MSMMVSFVLSFCPRDVLDEILNLIELVSDGFPSYSYKLLRLKLISTIILSCRQVSEHGIIYLLKLSNVNL